MGSPYSAEGLLEPLLDASDEELEAALSDLSDEQLRMYGDLATYDWAVHAREKQRIVDGAWRYWIILAGRNFGKTRTGSEWIRDKAMSGKYRWISMVGPTYHAVQTFMIDGPAGLLNISPPWLRPRQIPSRGVVAYPNGCEVRYFTAEKPNRLRGPEHEIVWMDELAAWPHLAEAFAHIDMGLRKGPQPQAVITTTPQPKAELVDLVLGPRDRESGVRVPRADVVVVRGKSEENTSTTKAWAEAMRQRYGASRLGRQELDAELLEKSGRELWSEAIINRNRVDGMPTAVKVVVAVDPTRSDSPTDEAGIVVAAVCEDGHGYVMHDGSGSMSPAQWTERAVKLHNLSRADVIVYEQNRLGKSAEATMRLADPRIKWVAVTATQGKQTRAEPVSALYEQGKVHHVGNFEVLEDEMTTWAPGSPSPNRMDALVWAITYLMLGETKAPLILR